MTAADADDDEDDGDDGVYVLVRCIWATREAFSFEITAVVLNSLKTRMPIPKKNLNTYLL